jgi:hypothetical protein
MLDAGSFLRTLLYFRRRLLPSGHARVMIAVLFHPRCTGHRDKLLSHVRLYTIVTVDVSLKPLD